MRPVAFSEPIRTSTNAGEYDRRVGKCTCGHVVQFTEHESEVVCPNCRQNVAPPAPEIRKGILS